MSRFKCQCGYVYEDSFKFCPECAEPNPFLVNDRKNTQQVENAEQDSVSPAPARKKFTRISPSSSEQKYSDYEQNTSTNRVAERIQNEFVEERYSDEPRKLNKQEEYDDTVKNSRSPLSARRRPAALSAPSYEVEEEYEDETEYTDEYEIEEEYEEVQRPPVKRLSISQSRPSEKKYDPNHDGYYDDRLPAVLDEATKISHMDVILKIVLAVVGIAALIVYCIFYVEF